MWLGNHVSGVLFLFNVHILQHLLRGLSKIHQVILGCQDIPKSFACLKSRYQLKLEVKKDDSESSFKFNR